MDCEVVSPFSTTRGVIRICNGTIHNDAEVANDIIREHYSENNCRHKLANNVVAFVTKNLF